MNKSDNPDGEQCRELEEAPFYRCCPVLNGEELIGEVSRRESDKQAEQGGGGQQPPVGVFWCIHRFLSRGCASPWSFKLSKPLLTPPHRLPGASLHGSVAPSLFSPSGKQPSGKSVKIIVSTSAIAWTPLGKSWVLIVFSSLWLSLFLSNQVLHHLVRFP